MSWDKSQIWTIVSSIATIAAAGATILSILNAKQISELNQSVNNIQSEVSEMIQNGGCYVGHNDVTTSGNSTGIESSCNTPVSGKPAKP
jgi:hypothetical protein